MSEKVVNTTEVMSSQAARMMLRSMGAEIPPEAGPPQILELALHHGIAEAISLGIEPTGTFGPNEIESACVYGRQIIPVAFGQEVLQLIRK